MSQKLEELLPEETLLELQMKISSGQTRLWKHWEAFVRNWLQLGKSSYTVQGVKDTLRFMLRNTDILTIEQCNDPILLEKTMLGMKEKRGTSGATYNTYLKNLNTYFIWLERKELIEENKIRKVARYKATQNTQLVLTDEQVQQIVVQIRTRRQNRLERSRNAFFIDLIRLTGARPVELLKLKVDDIISHKNSYKVRINGAKQSGCERLIPFTNSQIRDSFEFYMHIRKQLSRDEEYLFVSSSKRMRWTTKGMRGLFRNLAKELGFRITAYGFRRYVISRLYRQTKDMRIIGDYVGHTRATTTLRYIEKTVHRTQEAAEMMGRLM